MVIIRGSNQEPFASSFNENGQDMPPAAKPPPSMFSIFSYSISTPKPVNHSNTTQPSKKQVEVANELDNLFGECDDLNVSESESVEDSEDETSVSKTSKRRRIIDEEEDNSSFSGASETSGSTLLCL